MQCTKGSAVPAYTEHPFSILHSPAAPCTQDLSSVVPCDACYTHVLCSLAQDPTLEPQKAPRIHKQ